MISAVKQIVANVLPPVAIRGLRSILFRKPTPSPPPPFSEFEGDYSSFSDAANHSIGYDSEIIAQGAAKRFAAMLAENTTAEIDSRFQQVHSALSYVRGRIKKDRMSVLDIGGGAGTYYFVLNRLMSGVDLDWTVLETDIMVHECSKVPSSIRFTTEMPTLSYDAALISGALQYIDRPYELLTNAAKHSQWVILTRLPVQSSNRDKIVVQHVPPQIYEGSMPMFCFSEQIILQHLSKIGEIVLSWDVVSDSRSWTSYGFQSRGYLVRVH